MTWMVTWILQLIDQKSQKMAKRNIEQVQIPMCLELFLLQKMMILIPSQLDSRSTASVEQYSMLIVQLMAKSGFASFVTLQTKLTTHQDCHLTKYAM